MARIHSIHCQRHTAPDNYRTYCASPRAAANCGLGHATSARCGSPPITRTNHPACRAHCPDGSKWPLVSVASLSHAAFPRSQAGRHPRLHFRGLLRLSRYGRPLLGRRIKDARLGKPVIDHAIPREPVFLTAPSKRASPEVSHMVSERRKGSTIGWDRIVGKVASHDLPQPPPLFGDRLMHPAPKLRLNVLQLAQHAVASGLRLKLEVRAA
jgi:hypothetical protein